MECLKIGIITFFETHIRTVLISFIKYEQILFKTYHTEKEIIVNKLFGKKR